MNINCISYYQPNIYINPRKSTAKPSFTGGIPDALTHVNIGAKADGYIGKIRVRLADGRDAILNVFKRRGEFNSETYKIINDYNELIGEMKMTINKIFDYKKYDPNATDPSHVYVNTLTNYTRPGTPNYNPKLIHHKDIGTRLLQIAQRRSDEAMCNGELELIAKGDVMKSWYIDVLGMVQKYPPEPTGKLRFCVHNQNHMRLPAEAKERLSRFQGGL